MATWDEVDNQDYSDKDEGEVDLVLMVVTSSDTKFESSFGSKSENEDKVFLIYLVLTLYIVFNNS